MSAETGPSESEKKILAQVLQAIRQISYGSVQLTIQDSRVVQIDRTEKLRLGR
jgi:hypothetical protein